MKKILIDFELRLLALCNLFDKVTVPIVKRRAKNLFYETPEGCLRHIFLLTLGLLICSVTVNGQIVDFKNDKYWLDSRVDMNDSGFTKENKIKKPKEYSVAVHLHPLSLILSGISHLQASILKEKESLLYIYTTLEIPYDTAVSFIIKPSLHIDDSKSLIRLDNDFFRLGTDLGGRYYPNKKGQGFYVQGTVGLFHTITHPEDDPNRKSYLEVNAMGSVGVSIKPQRTNLSVFLDAGVGVTNIRKRVSLYNILFNTDHIIYDINLGVGYRF